MSLKELPSVEKLANSLSKSVSLPKPLIIGFIRRELDTWRQKILAGETAVRASIETSITESLNHFAASKLQPVINMRMYLEPNLFRR